MTADKDYRLESRHVGMTDFDTQVQDAESLICTLCAFEEKPLKPKTNTQAKKRTKKQILVDLNELKELRENELISEEVWKEKQRDILQDY